MVLVDTSVWADVFRRPAKLRLEDIVDLEDVVTCLPVIQEVLQGFDDERAHAVAREAMLAMPIAESPLRLETFERAVQLYRTARRAGVTVRSGTDCLIAACALAHGLTVLHCDRDYDAIARVSSLDTRNVGRRSR